MKARAAFLLLLSAPAWAGSGKDGFQVVRLSVSPRQAALAETGAADAPDADAFTLNPGALGLTRAPEASLAHTSLPLSVSLQSLAYVHPLSRSTLGARVSLLDAGGFKAYDTSGGPAGTVKAEDVLVSAGWGRRLSRGGSVGVSLSQARSSIGSDAATAWGLGLGWAQPLGSSPFRLSAALRNLGPKATYVREKTGLPQTMLAGVSYRGYKGALLAALEARRSSEGESTLAAGVEGWLHNTLALRAGWDAGRDLGNGVSVGMGFRLQSLRIDYAFQPGGEAFDALHRMGLSFRFGGAGDKAYQEGLTLSQRGHYPEAIFKFKEALDADPGHKEAVRALRDALGALEKETGGDK